MLITANISPPCKFLCACGYSLDSHGLYIWLISSSIFGSWPNDQTVELVNINLKSFSYWIHEYSNYASASFVHRLSILDFVSRLWRKLRIALRQKQAWNAITSGPHRLEILVWLVSMAPPWSSTHRWWSHCGTDPLNYCWEQRWVWLCGCGYVSMGVVVDVCVEMGCVGVCVCNGEVYWSDAHIYVCIHLSTGLRTNSFLNRSTLLQWTCGL